MIYIPSISRWCWDLDGADAQYLSQPTTAEVEGMTLWFGRLGDPCIARCPKVLLVGSGPAPVAMQCGTVAGLDAQGRHLCQLPRYDLWQCGECGAFLPHGEGGFCSEACRVVYMEPMADA
jgi:hypothetical protein